MDETHPRWREFKRAIKNYPDTHSCLIRDEVNTSKPNLLKLDWKRVGTGRSAEVCIFRIAKSLSTVERIRTWLEYHRFSKIQYKRRFPDDRILRNPGMGVARVGGWWRIEKYRAVNPSLLKSVFGLDLVRSYKLGIYFNEFGTVTHVGAVANTK